METNRLRRQAKHALGFLISGSFVVVSTAWAQGSGPGASAPAPAASGSASRPGASPPPYMYQEPLAPDQQLPAPGATAPAAPAGAKPVAGPPPGPPPPPPPNYTPYYVYEPLPPPPLRHRAPINSLWLGARGGVLFPSGAAYSDHLYYTAFGDEVVSPVYWSDLAGPGPSFEIDVGGRFSRRYIVYGLWEHAFLGTGRDTTTFGDQTSASTDLAGIGFRWSSNPDEVGVVVDLALGYRWFRESWANGTKVDMQGFGDLRFGIGADIRVTDRLALSPLFTLGVGEFSDRSERIAGQSSNLGKYAETHSTVGLTLGAHYDFAP